MFTGIVEEIGKVREATSDSLTIEAKKVLEGTKVGDSIDVNGACLTVTSIRDGSFTVEVMVETRRRTNLSRMGFGARVNLERALPAGGRMGGHLVQGHVDGLGRVVSVTAEEGAKRLMVSAPQEICRYIVKKGFVAVDGVSLTVVNCSDNAFSVSLVRLTQEETILGARRTGDTVNLEVDIIGKYVEKLLSRAAFSSGG